MRALSVLLSIMVVACSPPPAQDGACREQAFEGDRFTVCTYDPQTHDLRLAWRDAQGAAYRGFKALAKDVEQDQIAFAMNAGMYDHAGAPIGLYVENGRELKAISTTNGPGNFHLKPNGVFWVDVSGAPQVSTTDAYLAAAPAPLWATQSGPMLVIDGALHPAFEHDGNSRHVRNGVGVGDAGAAWFVISARPVSFGKFARLFRDELGSRNALYLDGAVSSLWAPSLKRMDDAFPLGPLVVVANSAR